MMSKIFLLIAVFIGFSVRAQVTTTALTPTQLVQNVLLGAGVTATNITYTGYANAISQFNATPGTNLGLGSGIYLTSGSSIQNDPNNTFSNGEDGPAGPASNFQSINNNEPGDPDLDAISGLTTYDAAILEFDFVPLDDTVSFRYIFGSEEYNEFVNSSWNDVFAFVISGVSTPLAPTNVALIPGTSTPVSINNVNNGDEDWMTGMSAGPCENCAYYRDNVDESIDVVYDGLTTVLTAVAPVICGETYHIKIMIADGGDGSYDSGVFLEAGSFSSPAAFTVSSSINGIVGGTTAIEGCDQFALSFVRPESEIGSAGSFDVVIGGSALNGIDYAPFPSTINFPVGVDTVTFALDPSTDGMVEGTENFTITIDNVSVCGVITSVVYEYFIQDVQTMSVTANDVSICPGASATLNAIANGGSGTLQYSWNGGALGTGASITVTPAVTTSYTVNVDDNCPGTTGATHIVTVNVIPAFTLSIPNQDTVFCANETTGTIVSQTTPSTPGAWTGSPSIMDNGDGTVSFNPSVLGVGNTTLTFTAGSSGCSSNESVVVIVNPFVSSGFNSIPILCQNSPLVPIVANSFTGDWYLDGILFTATSVNPALIPAGPHELKHVTGVPDCPDTTISNFSINPLPVVAFTVDTTKGCLSGGNGFNFTSNITPPGTTGDTYTWTFGDGSSVSGIANPVHFYGNAGVFDVTLTYVDINGCGGNYAETNYLTVHPQPTANFVNSNDNPSMIEPEINSTNLTQGLNNTYTWSLNNVYYSNDEDITVVFDALGLYPIQLQVTDENGCKDSLTKYVQVMNEYAVYIPSSFSPNGDGINDLFFPKMSGVYSDKGYKMQIYDRWGEKIFETEDYTNYWNGAKNNGGSRVVEGSYIYRIYFTALDNKTRLEQGHVVIFR